VRIPLDYYRILGLPIQASAEQLQQAYRDRILQLPRREYSEAAIASRKQLLDEAYEVLSNPEKRQSYDATFLVRTYETTTDEQTEPLTSNTVGGITTSIDPNTPSIEINDSEFLGALLILGELGEYELVLKLGRSFLSNGNVDIENGRFGAAKIVRPDIVLTLAQAGLELGREQWKQRRYENAAETLKFGQELLLREGLFTSVRGEVQADIYKLRPYRILELLAREEENTEQRSQGLQLLREMLQERGGIDGNGEDQSGLNVDEFLRFIQQLRGYLTVAQQQALFEQEARRPSAVATYLAVYALLARGFHEREPGLIRRAKLMLTRLLKRQDVYLEMAVCALLLGQTEEASQALELSGEHQSLAFIREHSQGSPDLLPGLCLYSEHWLQSEVFPHFRDLVNQQVSLKEYFADEQLQSSLEALPPETEGINDWEVVAAERVVRATTPSPSLGASTTSGRGFDHRALVMLGNQTQPSQVSTGESNLAKDAARGMGRTTALDTGVSNTSLRAASSLGTRTVPTAERVMQGGSGIESQSTRPTTETVIQGVSTKGQSTPENITADRETQTIKPPQIRANNRRSQRNRWPNVNLADWVPGKRTSSTPHSARGENFRQQPLVIFGLLGLLGIGISILVLSLLVNALRPKTREQAPQPVEQVEPSPLPTPETNTAGLSVPGKITPEIAEQAIKTWLDTKAKAFGPEHNIEELKNILVGSALSRWETLAQKAKSQNWYRKYDHSVKAGSVKVIRTTDEKARVEAQISESAEHFQGDKPSKKESYSSPNLRVRYDLVRQDGQWRIQDMVVLRK